MTQKELLKTLANMSEEKQNEFYNKIPEEDAKIIKQMVFSTSFTTMKHYTRQYKQAWHSNFTTNI